MRRLRAFAAAALWALCALPAPAADMSSAAWLPKPQPGGEPWSAAQIGRLRGDVDGLLESPALRGAHVGLLALDVTRKSVLYARLADDDFQPASNLKLLTGSAALARLGPAFTLRTTLESAAPIAGGVLAGDLTLRGGGDALLSAADLDAAAALLAAGGLTSITGNLVMDAGYFDGPSYPPGWSWDDFPYYYAPLVSALALEDNTIHLKVIPGAVPGAAARIEATPPTGVFAIENQIVTGPKDAKDTIDNDRTAAGNLRVFGTIAAGATPDSFSPSVPDPVLYAGDVLRRALAAHGIGVGGKMLKGASPPGALPLWVHESAPLAQLLADFWYPSDNLIGEVLHKALGVARAGVPGRSDPGIELEMDYLRSIGVDPATVAIADGSGLSTYNRLTPRALVAILSADWNSPYRALVLDALPVAGVRGTLADAYAGTAAERRVFAKTGSVSHASTLSGYVATRRHGTVVFSFLVGDWLGTPETLRAIRARVLARFAAD